MASFVEAAAVAGVPGTSKCTTTKEGSCDVMVCDLPASSGGGSNDPPPQGGEVKKSPSASDITIKAADEITLSPDGKGNYTPMTGQTALFAAGDDVLVKAKGAEVPAFSKTIKAPGIINVTAPEWPALGEAFTIDKANDLELTWENGGEGDVQATISSVADKKTSMITCKFKAADGTGKIAKAALGKLVASETGSISISSANTAAFDQNGWKLNVLIMSPGTAGGGMASGVAHIP